MSSNPRVGDPDQKVVRRLLSHSEGGWGGYTWGSADLLGWLSKLPGLRIWVISPTDPLRPTEVVTEDEANF